MYVSFFISDKKYGYHMDSWIKVNSKNTIFSQSIRRETGNQTGLSLTWFRVYFCVLDASRDNSIPEKVSRG